MRRIVVSIISISLYWAVVVFSSQGIWHVVDPSLQPSSESNCSMYENNYSEFDNFFREYGMWTQLASGLYDQNSTIYGSQYSIRYIWNHQHPKSCEGKKFAISVRFPSGFGSELHVLGLQLLAAIRLGVVLILHPNNLLGDDWKRETPFCKSYSSYESCYYRSFSSCTIYDAFGPDAVNILNKLDSHESSNNNVLNPIKDVVPGVLSYSVTKLNATEAEEIFSHGYKTIYFTGAPWYFPFCWAPVFLDVLKCSNINPRFHLYWWRAISIAYILRPNDRTLEWIEKEKLDLSDPYVGIYVRKGDKYLEMKLIETSAYFDAAEQVFRLPEYSTQNNPKRIFLGTEDPHVIKDFQKWSKDRKIKLAYTNLIDRSMLAAGLSKEEREKGSKKGHHHLEYFSEILNVYHLSRGTGYVCTLWSNFCRLIDELRAFYGRAQRPFADLSPESCSEPPCIYQTPNALQ